MFKYIGLFAAVVTIGLATVSTNAQAGAPRAGAVAGLIKSSMPLAPTLCGPCRFGEPGMAAGMAALHAG